jgi:hypothetical protein
MRRFGLIVVSALIAVRSYAQPHSPQEQDPHENSAGKNAPAKVAPEPPATTAVDSEDAILGTWELIPERSHFSPDATPPKEVRTYVKTSEGILATVTTTQPDGTMRSMAYPWRVDGKEYPVTGSPLLDTIVLKQVGNLTAEATLKHGDVVLASERREFSADGKTMSIIVKDLTSAEHTISSTAVYKQVAQPAR